LSDAGDQITVNLTFAGLSSAATGAEIGGPAGPGANAGIVFDFTGVLPPGGMSGTIPAQTIPVTPAQVADLKAGLWYFNVRSRTFAAGEVRGQIRLATVQFTTELSGAQEVPQVTTAATGTGTVALSDNGNALFLDLSFSGLTSPATTAHLHGPAAPGTNGGIQLNLAFLVPPATSGTLPQLIVPISPAQVADLQAGLYYFDVHTAAFPDGEIRGQLAVTLPAMSLDRTSLRFGATDSGAAFPQQTSGQTVFLLQSGNGHVAWTATPNQ